MASNRIQDDRKSDQGWALWFAGIESPRLERTEFQHPSLCDKRGRSKSIMVACRGSEFRWPMKDKARADKAPPALAILAIDALRWWLSLPDDQPIDRFRHDVPPSEVLYEAVRRERGLYRRWATNIFGWSAADFPMVANILSTPARNIVEIDLAYLGGSNDKNADDPPIWIFWESESCEADHWDQKPLRDPNRLLELREKLLTSAFPRGTSLILKEQNALIARRDPLQLDVARECHAKEIVRSFTAPGHFGPASTQAVFVDPPMENSSSEGTRKLLEHLTGRQHPRGAYLLGEFGSGKTLLLRNVQFELAQRWLTERRQPLPLWLDLRTYAVFPSRLEQLLTDALTVTFGQASAEAARSLVPDQLVMILDGLDEMASGEPLGNFTALLGQFDQASVGASFPRFVVASRFTFFQQLTQMYGLAMHESGMSFLRLGGWETQHIARYLKQCTDAGALKPQQRQTASDLMLKNDAVRAVCSKPLVCTMLVTIWQTDPAFTPRHPFEVFETYIEKGVKDWASRIAQVAHPIDLKVLDRFVDRLVLSHMVQENRITAVSASQVRVGLQKLIKRHSLVSTLESALRQVTTRSILKAVDGGDAFEMFHNQMAEYIIARNMRDAILAAPEQAAHPWHSRVFVLMRANPLLQSSILRTFVKPMAEAEGWRQQLQEWLAKTVATASP